MRVAGGDYDMRTLGGQGPGRFRAKPAGRAGDKRQLAGKVDAFENLIGGGVVAEIIALGGVHFYFPVFFCF